jgi:hypothetical protein
MSEQDQTKMAKAGKKNRYGLTIGEIRQLKLASIKVR